MSAEQPRGMPGGRVGVQQKLTGQQKVEVALKVVGQQNAAVLLKVVGQQNAVLPQNVVVELYVAGQL
jgi:hypothetical protein